MNKAALALLVLIAVGTVTMPQNRLDEIQAPRGVEAVEDVPQAP